MHPLDLLDNLGIVVRVRDLHGLPQLGLGDRYHSTRRPRVQPLHGAVSKERRVALTARLVVRVLGVHADDDVEVLPHAGGEERVQGLVFVALLRLLFLERQTDGVELLVREEPRNLAAAEETVEALQEVNLD